MAAGAVKVTGIVLSTIPIGEYDRRLIILTREKGKITVFAKGARRPTSVFLAYTQPFTFAVFDVYAGRNCYHLQGAEKTKFFPEIRDNLESIYYAMFFCELADYFSRENSDDNELLKLLYKSFTALCSERINLKLIGVVFEWKTYYINGIGARVFDCIKCKKSEKLTFFSAKNGGVICNECAEKYRDSDYFSDAIKVSESTVYTLQYIASTKINGIYDFSVSDEVLNELIKVVESFREYHIDRRLKTLESLKDI